MNVRIPPKSLKPFLEGREGRKYVAYLDPKVWTIGVGHTGKEVVQGLRWTDEQIDAAYEQDVMDAAIMMPLPSRSIFILSDNQYAALLSFVFNLGPRSSATLWKRINQGRLDLVPGELTKWKMGWSLNKFKIPVYGSVPGLVNRRAAEIVLWNTKDTHA